MLFAFLDPAQNAADLLVPAAPFVPAGAFLVGVVGPFEDVHVLPHCLIIGVEGILGAAPLIEAGQGLARNADTGGQGKQVVFTACMILRGAENIGPEGLRAPIHAIEGDIRARQPCGGGIALGIGQSQSVGTVAAHREPRNIGILPLGRNAGEQIAADEGQLFPDEGAPFAPVLHIGIPAKLGGGHNHGDAHFIGIPLDGGAAAPDGMIVAHAVEQIENGIGGVAHVGGIHADQPRRANGLRQDHVHGRAAAQGCGKKGNL